MQEPKLWVVAPFFARARLHKLRKVFSLGGRGFSRDVKCSLSASFSCFRLIRKTPGGGGWDQSQNGAQSRRTCVFDANVGHTTKLFRLTSANAPLYCARRLLAGLVNWQVDERPSLVDSFVCADMFKFDVGFKLKYGSFPLRPFILPCCSLSASVSRVCL